MPRLYHVNGQGVVMICKWCGRERDSGTCDCDERMDCDKAGEICHQSCGKLPCGQCPKWMGKCDPTLHDQPRWEEPELDRKGW